MESAADAVAIRAVPGGDPADVRELSYREIDEASSRLARELIDRGIGPGDRVVVAIGRSVRSVLAVWAIAKAGAVYVPVDPASAPERVAHVVTESVAALGLTTTEYRAALGEDVQWVALDEAPMSARVDARAAHPISYTDRVRLLTELHPAYLVAAAGRSEGVVGTHTGLATVVNAVREQLGVDGDSRVLHLGAPDTGLALLELLLTFSCGAMLIVPPPEVSGGPELADLLRREQITHLLTTPDALASVDPAGLDDLEAVAVIGDRCDAELVGGWACDGRAFHTAHGFAEATILDTISGALRPGEFVTTGVPIAGVGAYVLDSRLRPVPAGSVGELYLSGSVLAQGYSGNAGLTAVRFVADPFGAETGQSGMRLFRTGDLVRRNDSDGSLELVGRVPERKPGAAVERTIVDVFGALLGVAPGRIEPAGDFFELGGDSPLAAEAAALLGAALDLWVPARFIIETPTVRGLAERVGRYREAVSGRGLRPMPRPGRIPLSHAQQRSWFRNRFDPANAADNVPAAVRVSGRLDIGALCAAVRDLVLRHEVLRTVYPESGGEGYQLVLPITDSRTIPDVPVSEVPDGELPGALAEILGAGFDVTAAPPVRFRVLASGDAGYVLMCVVHHVVADGFSVDTLIRDLLAAYRDRLRGEQPDRPVLEVQYADYALWQRELLGAEDDPDSELAQQIRFWHRELAGLPEQWDLPVDQPRSEITAPRAARLEFEIDASVHAALIRLARAHDATVFMLAHTALAMLLARLTATRDIAISTSVDRRAEPALQQLIGTFANTLVLRTTIDPGIGFAELLAAVRATDLAAFAHADVPFEQLAEQVNPVRSMAGHPLVPVALTVERRRHIPSELPDSTVSGMEFDTVPTGFDLRLTLTEHLDDQDEAQGILARFTYVAGLFDDGTVRDIAHRLGRVIDAVLADDAVIVGDIGVLMPGERELVLREWNTAGIEPPALTIGELIAEHARHRPAAIAVRCGDTTLGFGELLRRANQVARALIECGVGPESLVAVAVERTAELPVALLGVVLSGAGYLPVDIAASAQQVEFVLADAAPDCVLTATVARMFLPLIETAVVRLDEVDRFSDAPVTAADRISPSRPENTACVIYGSAAPVSITHRALLELFTNARPLFDFAETDVWALCHSYADALSLWELWGALVTGAAVVVVDRSVSGSPELLRESLIREQVTVLQQTSPEFAGLVEADRFATSSEPGRLALRYVVLSDAEMDPVPVQRWYDRHAVHAPQLMTMYGTTETASHTSCLALDAQWADDPVRAIGRALPGSSCVVLDDRLHPAPMGVAGEMYIAGRQIPRGYARHAGLTATRFVANPFGAPGSRMYRSGDVTRWIGFGGEAVLEYVEHRDQQMPPRDAHTAVGDEPAVQDNTQTGRTGVPSEPAVTQDHSSEALIRSGDVSGDSDGTGRWSESAVTPNRSSDAPTGPGDVGVNSDDPRIGRAEMLPGSAAAHDHSPDTLIGSGDVGVDLEGARAGRPGVLPESVVAQDRSSGALIGSGDVDVESARAGRPGGLSGSAVTQDRSSGALIGSGDVGADFDGVRAGWSGVLPELAATQDRSPEALIGPGDVASDDAHAGWADVWSGSAVAQDDSPAVPTGMGELSRESGVWAEAGGGRHELLDTSVQPRDVGFETDAVRTGSGAVPGERGDGPDVAGAEPNDAGSAPSGEGAPGGPAVGFANVMSAGALAQPDSVYTTGQSGMRDGLAAGAAGAALPQALAAIVEDDPDGPALISDAGEVSYAELDARSARMARVLIARGCGPDIGVAVRFDRGIDAAVAVWAVLKAGAAVVFTDAIVPDAAVGLTGAGMRDYGGTFEWLDPADPAVADEIAAQSARPVTYADRTRPLRGGHPALRTAGTALTYDELAAAVERLRSATELTVESRTFRSGEPQSPSALLEIVAAGAAGATLALPGGADSAALAEHWVTHLFIDPDDLASLDPGLLEDLRAVILDRGPKPMGGFGAAETFMVLNEVIR